MIRFRDLDVFRDRGLVCLHDSFWEGAESGVQFYGGDREAIGRISQKVENDEEPGIPARNPRARNPGRYRYHSEKIVVNKFSAGSNLVILQNRFLFHLRQNRFSLRHLVKILPISIRNFLTGSRIALQWNGNHGC